MLRGGSLGRPQPKPHRAALDRPQQASSQALPLRDRPDRHANFTFCHVLFTSFDSPNAKPPPTRDSLGWRFLHPSTIPTGPIEPVHPVPHRPPPDPVVGR